MILFWTKAAYALNAVILAPVLISMFSDKGNGSIRAFQGAVQNSDGLRLLIASFWSAIFLLSVAGFLYPKFFLPILILQVIYKSLYLLTYVLPKLKAKSFVDVPVGISISFLLIVVVYPFIIWSAINTE